MIKFTHDGKRLLVVNEGEAPDDGHSDPVGSIGVVDISNGAENHLCAIADLTRLKIRRRIW